MAFGRAEGGTHAAITGERSISSAQEGGQCGSPVNTSGPDGPDQRHPGFPSTPLPTGRQTLSQDPAHARVTLGWSLAWDNPSPAASARSALPLPFLVLRLGHQLGERGGRARTATVAKFGDKMQREQVTKG